MAPVDPPWRLDPFQNIINVGWGGGIIVVGFEYEFSASVRGAGAEPTWNAFFTAGTDVADLRGESLLQELGPRVNPPGPPSTTPPPGVAAENNFWHYPRINENTTETEIQTFHCVDLGRYVIFTNLGVINNYSDALDPTGHLVPFRIDHNSTVTIVGGGTGDNTIGALAPGFDAFLSAYMQFVVDRTLPGATSISAMLIEELAGHDEQQNVTRYEKHTRTITFVNHARVAGNDEAIKAAGELRLVMQMQGATDRQFLQWHVGVETYTGTREFAINEDAPAFVERVSGGGQPDSKEEDAHRAPEQAAPAVQVTFTINLKTLKIAVSRQNI